LPSILFWFLRGSLSQPHPRSSSVLVDELDAGSFNGLPQLGLSLI